MALIPSYYEGLLSEDDMSSLRNQSLASGLLSAGAAFSRAGAPSLMPGGSGFSEALQGFNQGYQGQLDSALNNMLKATQVQELVRKQKQAQQLNQIYQGAYTPGKQTAIPSEVGPAVIETPGSFDMAKVIPQLQRLGPEGSSAIKDFSESIIAARKAGLMRGDTGQSPSPFAAYTQATSPQVRTLAAQLEQGFKSGVIDEETAYKRLDSLSKMEDSYLTRKENQADRQVTREVAQAERDAKKLEIPAEQQKQVVGIKNTVNAIQEFRDELPNFSTFSTLSPTARAKMSTKYRNMLLQAKEAYNLGVLNGPDLTILESIVVDPTSFSGAIVGKDVIDTQASELSRIIQNMGAVSVNKVRPNETITPQAPRQPIPANAINLLKSNPALSNDFDSKYGAGASKRILGK